MAVKPVRKANGKGVRKGTATRRAGKETAARLVQAAYELLETERYERFSMRNVAERAGVSLANLQYYFPRREDLAQALSNHMDTLYRAAYEECLIDAPESPKERFKLILRYNMQEISKQSTRQFFIQLWALLGSMDDFAGHHLSELYAIDINQLSEHIEAIHPNAGTGEIRKRATLIAAMIEGLMVVMGDTSQDENLTENLLDYAFETALAIADGYSVSQASC
jgi:TetR/AcrR family transcriptional regulator